MSLIKVIKLKQFTYNVNNYTDSVFDAALTTDIKELRLL